MKVHATGEPAAFAEQKQGRLGQVLERLFVGRSDSADYSEAWKVKFSHAPTWCDADMSLQQMNRGLASGNRAALYSRSFFQHCLYSLGCFVQRHAWATIIIGTILYTACCWGLQHVIIETDLVKLWVPQGGRLNEELGYLSHAQAEARAYRYTRQAAIQPSTVTHGNVSATTPPPAPQLPIENGLGGGFQVVIQTPTFEGENALTKENLLKHVDLMIEIAQYKVELHGENWTLADICFKPPSPRGGKGPLQKVMNSMLEKIIPCIWITPIDCFWEGSKPLGPYPPMVFGEEITAFVSSLPKGNVTWKNLNPTAVVNEVSQLFDMGPVANFFERAGIDGAYLDRPCIDPLDPECPSLSPNFFDRCGALQSFLEWNGALPEGDRVVLDRKKTEEAKGSDAEAFLQDLFGKKRKKRAPETTTKSEDYYAFEDDDEYVDNNSSTHAAKKTLDPKEIACREYGESLMMWMQKNKEKWGLFLTEKQLPKYPNYGEAMTGGCRGFGKKIMEWPEDLIIGGVKRENHRVASADALQSVFLVASAGDVHTRYRKNNEIKKNLDLGAWSRAQANDVIVAWQRNFTKKLYGHKKNFEIENVRQFHPLASTSIADMLEEFSQFNYIIIFAGYFLMLVYAAFTQARLKGAWFAVNSNVFLAFWGVVWVTYSSICGLGFCTLLGINFNAATTQIVPFLSLGLGIDDMFLLLHNYDEIAQTIHKREMGVLLKETGMSVLVTSTNNILAFLAGIVLPIPALRSFCSQTAILLAFNLIFLMVLFPAFITIDLRRRRRGERDLSCGCCSVSEMPSVPTSETIAGGVSSQAELTSYQSSHEGEVFVRNDPWYTVGGFLTNHYIPMLKKNATKVIVISVTMIAFFFGLIGMYRSTLGLELSDVLPEGTAPAAFLQAREKYFSFYPMFAVIKGDVDIPQQQLQLEQYRSDLSKSRFVIKNDAGESQPYWMQLMRIWLQSLDASIEKSILSGEIDKATGDVIPGKKLPIESEIGRILICSVGYTFNCTNRIGTVPLVKDKVINPEGFYNYLTAWYNIDNMMYYVSQASFVPVPPFWEFDPKSSIAVPPARRLLYSQIPFYTTGLTTTPVIVESIKELRATCEEYEEKGLANFPTGLAFTFWEQYLSLRWNLFLAIMIIAAAVFSVISVLIFNPYAAAMVMVIVVVTTVELGGFMGLFGVKMNPISAVTLICAVGIGVEFTAHVVLAFLTALGDTNQRLQACLEHMFVPVFHGAISTLLGIVMLVFTEFDFVFKYFFVTMTFLVLLGVFNGLCLLPVLLTLIGPHNELVVNNGSDRLPAPPPLSKQRLSGESSLRRRKGNECLEMESPPAAHAFHESLSTITEDEVKRQ